MRPSACCRPRWCWCWAPGCSRCRSAAACWTSTWPRCCWCWTTWRWAYDAVPVPAVDPAVRLHVPVRRHATAGAVAGRSAAADPLPATGARHHAARRLAVGAVARRTGAAGLHRGDDDAGDPALPQAPGLKHAFR
ncbi:hypothetical protein G6F58_013327 [Rhizopus delemar]|nr:hypothetical protein G6F58_013327 [Rhizopus delemar]